MITTVYLQDLLNRREIRFALRIPGPLLYAVECDYR